ncbi:MAG: precorrin-6Y C5,15-methyltransferase (decarboxylating) subunit CbiT [Euryarchaeota archaeon]|nr:precorrin-6Y C5,15-methyltransferase (decarboxylating) subunit CbiT [Euryarchaeota archaeon]
MPELLHIGGGPTKPEIISISLSKLDLCMADTFFDIGCGTGAVSIAATTIKPDLKIFAIDAREKAFEVAAQNFENFNIENVTLVHGESAEVLQEKANVGTIDCAFVGGTKNIANILDVLYQKKARNIVVNAVRIETVVAVMNKMKELGLFSEIVHVALSRGHPITGETMFKPENPVYIIVGKLQNGSH